MKFTPGFKRSTCAIFLMVFAAPATPYFQANADEKLKLTLTIMGTSDLHTNIVAYDYYKDTPTESYGMSKIATLISQVRKENPDALLFDAGDLIQGSPLGDVSAKINPLKPGQTHPVYKVMNFLKYDAATLGNHEFNFGIEFLQNTLKGAKFPYVSANILLANTNQVAVAPKPFVAPYIILDRVIGGEKIKVGVIGFAPPQITMWDKDKLGGRIVTQDILESAKKYVPKMKSEGADVIVAVAHSGINPLPYQNMMENASYYLAKLDGIDTVLTGHSHMEFPGKKFDGQENLGIDSKAGTIAGKPVTMPGFWGSHLGVVTLKLEKKNGHWQSVGGESKLLDSKTAKEDTAISELVKAEHLATLDYVRRPVGKFETPVHTYFSRIQDSAAIQLVNEAQEWFVSRELKGTPNEKYPVLSASAPFKAGFGGEYTDIPAGEVAVKHIADLYVYPNTIKAVLLTGAQVKAWLEKSAGNFSRIEPTTEGEINLVDDKYKSYNFDVLDPVSFVIDISKPLGERITQLKYKGKEIALNEKFVVATNNFRAFGGGAFPGLDGTNVILDSASENREILIEYIKSKKSVSAKAHNNWSIAPINAPKAKIIFETDVKSEKYAPKWATIESKDTVKNTIKYRLNLSKGTAH